MQIEIPEGATLWYDVPSMISDIRAALPEGFDVNAGSSPNQILVTIPGEEMRQLFLPESWAVWAHEKGFGGWLLQGGRTLRFARVMVSLTGRDYVMQQAISLRDTGADLRDEYSRDVLREEIRISGGFTFLDLNSQLRRTVVSIISGMASALQRRSDESIYRQQALFRRGVNEWLLKFPPMPNPNQQIPFYQNQVKIDWEEFPSGARELVRDEAITWLYENAFQDLRKAGTYICDPTATSKGNPGDWVSVVRTENQRLTVDGEIIDWDGLKSPVLLAATQPICGNTRRANREFGGMKNALQLVNPKRLEDGLRNGFEPYLTPAIRACLTLGTVAFFWMEGVNGYDGRNLDDILVTPDGHKLLTTKYNERRIIPADQWDHTKNLYLDEDGKVREGFEVIESLVPETSYYGTPLYNKEYIVTDNFHPEEWIVGKVIIDSTLKAMAKLLTHKVIGIDRHGARWVIDCIVSGQSIRDKKVQTVVLSAVLSRLGFGYIPDPENVIHPDRQENDGPDSHPDLVREAYNQLLAQGESPDGTMAIYRFEDNEMHYLGEAVVGICRMGRLAESERTSSRIRAYGAIPVQTPLRHLDRRPAVCDPETRDTFNMLADTWKVLTDEIDYPVDTIEQ